MTVGITNAILGLMLSGVLAGFVLFRKNKLNPKPNITTFSGKISVIIPARNEETNLPYLLQSLQNQTIQPNEIIVVDDHSTDSTKSIAESFVVKVLSSPELPNGWTGKNWALWNGYLHSTGDLLIFLDADVRLKPTSIQSLIAKQQEVGGAISVVPYHTTEEFYETFAMIINLLASFVFTSPFEKWNPIKGMFGACIVCSRADYEKIGGHKSIRSEIIDDLNLGAALQKAGINVNNYIGHGIISFRMYPNGLKSELEGFSKSAFSSISKIHPITLGLIILWLIGLIISQLSWFFIQTSFFIPLITGYVLYMFQIFYLNYFIGRFGIVQPIFHFLSMIFFFVMLLYSLYQAVFLKKAIWKGRYINIGRRDNS